MLENNSIYKVRVQLIISIVVFTTIYAYYFWLAYNIPLLTDDFKFLAWSKLGLAELHKTFIDSLKWNTRIGEFLLKTISYLGIPYYFIMPIIHIINLLLAYYIVKDQRFKFTKLNNIKDFFVLFTLYTFLNSAPFQAIVWKSGTISNTFGFIFLLLFFAYLKKTMLLSYSTHSKNIALHVVGLFSAYLAGWAQESVPAHIIASFVFICFYLNFNNINIIKYLVNKKSIIIAYALSACGWFSQAIISNFWDARLPSHNPSTLWKFHENLQPIPAVIKILLVAVTILLVYYFVNQRNLSNKTKKYISFVFILTLLNLLTCLVNIKISTPRAFLYHSFIASGILFYIYLKFTTNSKKKFINKVIFISLFLITLNNGYLFAYSTLLEAHRSNYRFKILEENYNKNEINLPKSSTIPEELFFKTNLTKLAKITKKNTKLINRLSYMKYDWTSVDHFEYSGLYLKLYYPNIKKINFINYEDFIFQNKNNLTKTPNSN